MKRTICTAAILSILLTGCQTVGPKEKIGTFAGVGAGALIGSQFGHGNGRVASALLGAAVFGFLGNRIGAQLDEQDRQNLARITRQAASSGRSSHFRNLHTGVSGSARVVRSSINSVGETCRTVEQEVVLRDGTVSKDTVSACKGKNGWTV